MRLYDGSVPRPRLDMPKCDALSHTQPLWDCQRGFAAGVAKESRTCVRKPRHAFTQSADPGGSQVPRSASSGGPYGQQVAFRRRCILFKMTLAALAP